MVKIEVSEGDATQIPCDALIACITGKLWFGGIDRAIQRVAGGKFHAIAAKEDLEDGKIIWANPHTTTLFRAVCFIVDDVTLPLKRLVWDALQVCADHGARYIVLPALRSGVMLDIAPESGKAGIVQAILGGIRGFERDEPGVELSINLCVFHDPDLAAMFRKEQVRLY